MMDTLRPPDEQKIAEALDFIRSFSSVIIGSVSKSGEPHTSYAPYITDSNKLYIYVSALAQHASTLKNGTASLFFIEDEQQAKNIFARRRLNLNCRVSSLKKSDPRYDRLLDTLQSKHGSTVKLLRTLPDFMLFELDPERATFVTGFGAAYDLSEFMIELLGTAK